MDCGLELQDSRSHVQGGTCMEDLQRSNFRPDQTVFGLKAWTQLSKKPPSQINCRIGSWKFQTAYRTPQQGNLRGIDRWQRLLQGDCWRSLETVKPCIVRQVRGTSDLHYSHWCKHKTVRFRKQRSMRKSKARTHGSHFRNPSMWEVFITAWCTSQSVSKKLWKYQKPKPQWT